MVEKVGNILPSSLCLTLFLSLCNIYIPLLVNVFGLVQNCVLFRNQEQS